jgi:hypothetical protein
MAAFSGHVCPVGPQIIIWESTDSATTPVRVTVDAHEVHVNGPRPDSTAMPEMTAPAAAPRNRAERRAAAARARKR